MSELLQSQCQEVVETRCQRPIDAYLGGFYSLLTAIAVVVFFKKVVWDR